MWFEVLLLFILGFMLIPFIGIFALLEDYTSSKLTSNTKAKTASTACVYLTASDVTQIAHCSHYIPMSKGYTSTLMIINYPGWSYNLFIDAFKKARNKYPYRLHENLCGFTINLDGTITEHKSKLEENYSTDLTDSFTEFYLTKTKNSKVTS